MSVKLKEFSKFEDLVGLIWGLPLQGRGLSITPSQGQDAVKMVMKKIFLTVLVGGGVLLGTNLFIPALGSSLLSASCGGVVQWLSSLRWLTAFPKLSAWVLFLAPKAVVVSLAVISWSVGRLAARVVFGPTPVGEES